MTIHELKTNYIYFYDAVNRNKNFTVRKNDRYFQIGDIIKKITTLPNGNINDFAYFEITYILHGGQHGIAENYVVMEIKYLGRNYKGA